MVQVESKSMVDIVSPTNRVQSAHVRLLVRSHGTNSSFLLSLSLSQLIAMHTSLDARDAYSALLRLWRVPLLRRHDRVHAGAREVGKGCLVHDRWRTGSRGGGDADGAVGFIPCRTERACKPHLVPREATLIEDM